MTKFLRWMFPPYRRQYVRSHPLAVWFSLGIALYGGITLIANPMTAPSTTLPDWQLITFRVTWLVGGVLAWYGINRGRSKPEAAGMVLLATGLIVNFLAVMHLNVELGWPAGLFLVPLAIGCVRRALYIVSQSNGGPDGPELIP